MFCIKFSIVLLLFVPVFGAIFKLPSFHLMKNNEDDTSLENSIDEEYDHYSAALSEEEFTALRIEYIKNQILKKLRLKEKPQIHMSTLPQPLKESDSLFPDENMEFVSTYGDDFYGKTTQAVVFPYEDEARCLRKVLFPSRCLPFQLPNDIHGPDVSTAELWFHKKPDLMDTHNQTFIISEVAHWDTNKSFQKTKPIAIEETDIKEGWLKIDVTYVVKTWMDHPDNLIHAINVVCKTCGMDKNQSPISSLDELKPFLIIYTHSQPKRAMLHRRPKRSLDCSVSKNECCRESLNISFADIGWDDWIIKPQHYNAYFCRGSCTTPTAIMNLATTHGSILQKFMNRGGISDSRPELTPCCAATQFQPLQLAYLNSNKTLTTRVLPNMIVETCGCM